MGVLVVVLVVVVMVVVVLGGLGAFLFMGGGTGGLLLLVMCFIAAIFFLFVSRQVAGKPQKAVPNLLIERPDHPVPAPYVDATGSHAGALLGTAAAQTFPVKPVRLVVPVAEARDAQDRDAAADLLLMKLPCARNCAFHGGSPSCGRFVSLRRKPVLGLPLPTLYPPVPPHYMHWSYT